MKRTAMVVAILSVAMWAGAQTVRSGPDRADANRRPSAGNRRAARAGDSGDARPRKRPPQAKTAARIRCLQSLSAANTDAAALEKATDDFAVKFPDSELRLLLYKAAMRTYQSANNAEKTEAMGRKVLSHRRETIRKLW